MPRSSFGALLAAVTIPRALVFAVNENLYGDAIPRTELAERWMQQPHLITAFGDGAHQFGALNLYLIGLSTLLFDREDAGRVVSLVFGLVTVVPMFLLARRMFNARAGVVACLALAAWGLHVQFSTTAGSEAVSLFFTLASLACFAAGLDTQRFRDVAAAAVCLTAATAVRYDPWMHIVLVPAAVVATRRSPGLRHAHAAGFVLIALLFPLAWMLGNWLWHGDPLFPFAFIDADHRRWAESLAGGWMEWWTRAQGVLFWPAMACMSLSPGIAAFAAVGMIADWRERRENRWIVVVATLPLVYYGIRTAVLFNFVPLTRFMATSLALMLPFVWRGYVVVRSRWDERLSWRLARIAAVTAVILPLVIGVCTFRVDGPVVDVLRPISATSTNPRAVMSAATELRAALEGSSERIAVDEDARYLDINLVFYSRLPEGQVLRLRWPGFSARFDEAPPALIVRFDKGRLTSEPGVQVDGDTLIVRGQRYMELRGFEPPVHVYRRAGGDGKITVWPDRQVVHDEHASRSQPAQDGLGSRVAAVSAGRVRPAGGGLPHRRARGSRHRGPQGREQSAAHRPSAGNAAAYLQPMPRAL